MLRYVPPPLRTVRPSSSPYTPYACGVQRALLPVAVGAMNIHDVRDRQTDRRQTSAGLDIRANGLSKKMCQSTILSDINVTFVDVFLLACRYSCVVFVAN